MRLGGAVPTVVSFEIGTHCPRFWTKRVLFAVERSVQGGGAIRREDASGAVTLPSACEGDVRRRAGIVVGAVMLGGCAALLSVDGVGYGPGGDGGGGEASTGDGGALDGGAG